MASTCWNIMMIMLLLVLMMMMTLVLVTKTNMVTKMTLPGGTRHEAAGGRPDYDDDTDDGEDNKDDDENDNDDYIRWHQARSCRRAT